MIHEVIPVIAGELNEYLQSHFGAVETVVEIGNYVNQDGTLALREENKIILSVVNLERDGSNTGFGNPMGTPPVYINVYFMVAAYFNNMNYAEGLKYLSGSIAFFQSKNVFNHHNTPELSSNISKVQVEVVNLEFRELVNLWSLLGAKYLPSIIYKLRTLDMEGDNMSRDIPLISGITT